MDIDQMKQHRISKTNNKDESIAFSQSIGSRMSAMEHLVPEQMFSTEENSAQGISAVKALAIASQQGQKIWTIDKNNVNLALSRINLGADAENDIRNAVYAGKIATAHEARINFNGWVGEGYTLIDPKTGAGAYMISGGGNGSETSDGLISPMSGLGLLADLAEIIGKVGDKLKGFFPPWFFIFDSLSAISDGYEAYKKCGYIAASYPYVIGILFSILMMMAVLVVTAAAGPLIGWLIAVMFEAGKTIIVDSLKYTCDK